MKIVHWCCLALALFMTADCGAFAPERRAESALTIRQEQGANPWTHLEFRNDPHAFQFAVVSDRTGGHRPGVFPEAVRKLNLLQPEFVMCIGDLIEGYTEDGAELDRQWDEFLGFVRELEMPFFFVPGNHDISNPVMAEEWRERFGRSYYHFVYRDVLFLCLNSEDGTPHRISPEQLDWFGQTLRRHRDARWTFVFLHKPFWTDESVPEAWLRVEKLLADRPHTVFTGHIHKYTKYTRHGRSYLTLATTGGGSALAGPEYGEFDHVVWVTMADDGPRIANLMPDGIRDEDVLTEEMIGLWAPFRRGEAITVGPIFAEPGLFRRATTQIRLNNRATWPMKATVTFRPDGALRVSPEALEITVAPESAEVRELAVEASTPLEATEAPTVTMNWEATYDLPGRNPARLAGSSAVGLAVASDCPRRRAPVRVDGNLGEWEELPFVCSAPRQILLSPDTWHGPQDCSFRFAVEHDEEHLYVALEAQDDRSFLDADRQPWQQDGVEVRIDARPEPHRSAGRGGGEFGEILLIALSPGETPDRMVYYERAQMPPGVEAVCTRTPGGHVTEIAVPVRYLNEKQGREWEAFRLNIAVDDFDGPQDAGAQLWWRPDWRSPATYAGSGTFRRGRRAREER